MEAELIKVEDIEGMMKYNVLTTPVLMINEEIKVTGRIADVNEIKQLYRLDKCSSPILATLDWTTHLYPSAYTTVQRFNNWSILLFTLVLLTT